MTIAIDCRMLGSSGVGVYLQGCLPYFLKSKHNFLLFGNYNNLQSYSLNSNVIVIPCNIKPFSLKDTFFFPSKTIRQLNNADVFFSPFFNIVPVSIPVFTTIHDIIFPDIVELTGRIGLAVRMWFFRRAYKKSRKIFTVSEFSKSRIEFHLGKTKPVVVTHSAIQDMFLKYRDIALNKQKKQTIIFIGNIKKHKGLNILLDAFALAKNEGLPYSLLIIGEKENFRTADKAIKQKIDSLGTQAVCFTGLISNEKLMEHLAQASLLVQPSLYEGFCLPPLEAMVLGTHALVSDIEVLKEIYAGFPVTFFQAGSKEDLKEKMLELLLNKNPPVPVLPDDLLLKYTFDKTASTILKELESK